MKEWVYFIFVGVLYNLILYIRELIKLLSAGHFQGLLHVAINNKDSIPGLHILYVVYVRFKNSTKTHHLDIQKYLFVTL